MLEKLADAFRQSAGMMTFLTIFGIGLAISIFSLMFGGDHGDGDVGHDAAGEVDGGHFSGVFSIRGLSLFATAFGGVGLLVMYFTHNVLLSSLAGVGVGVVFAGLGLSMMRALIRQQSSSMMEAQDFVGLPGEVVTSIPAGGRGEVRILVGGRTMTMSANAVGGGSLPNGATVRVVRHLAGTLSVEAAAEGESGA